MLNADVGAVLWYSVVVDLIKKLIFTPIGDAFPGIGAHLGSAAGGRSLGSSQLGGSLGAVPVLKSARGKRRGWPSAA